MQRVLPAEPSLWPSFFLFLACVCIHMYAGTMEANRRCQCHRDVVIDNVSDLMWMLGTEHKIYRRAGNALSCIDQVGPGLVQIHLPSPSGGWD